MNGIGFMFMILAVIAGMYARSLEVASNEHVCEVPEPEWIYLLDCYNIKTGHRQVLCAFPYEQYEYAMAFASDLTHKYDGNVYGVTLMKVM